MTKSEVKNRLIQGKTLESMFQFTDSPNGTIYKNGVFKPEDVVYIPDIYMHDIPIDRPIPGDMLEEVMDLVYTGQDFLDICKGNFGVAAYLLSWVDWELPDSAVCSFSEFTDEEFEELAGCTYFELFETGDTVKNPLVKRMLNEANGFCQVTWKQGTEFVFKFRKDGATIFSVCIDTKDDPEAFKSAMLETLKGLEQESGAGYVLDVFAQVYSAIQVPCWEPVLENMFRHYIERKRYNYSCKPGTQDDLYSSGETAEAEKWLRLFGVNLSYERIQDMVCGKRKIAAFD